MFINRAIKDALYRHWLTAAPPRKVDYAFTRSGWNNRAIMLSVNSHYRFADLGESNSVWQGDRQTVASAPCFSA